MCGQRELECRRQTEDGGCVWGGEDGGLSGGPPSHFTEELKAENSSYLWQHPVLRATMADFLPFLLLRKPSNVFMFACEYFSPFVSHRPPGGTFNTSSP
ncbi:ciliogenesis-associated TTC17-interacting protein-like [Salmo trutta]|uniref:ciliogenesis-associated TTC17-interacting protein-like n=1 Tax=Salmo trutta TaxID=8032 RepID=UPI0011303379|nr:ciliogenesis-associated TTC17-interacting protein-like [Salmo trutta]